MALMSHAEDYPVKSVAFSPYANNGGTVMAIAGENYAVLAADTRLMEGYMIHSRNCIKTYQLTSKTFLVCAGFHGDVLTLTKNLEIRTKMYMHEHNQEMSTEAVAAMLSTILYYRRFFPYYVYNIVAGIDSEGKGAVYSFDPVGSYEREVYRAGGSSGAILQPLLDNQIGLKNQSNITEAQRKAGLSKEKAISLVKDVYTSAAERDIQTGDGVEITLVSAGADKKVTVQQETVPLRKD